MRKLLLILGILLSAGGSAAWALMGANMGWTKTKVLVMKPEPITGIEEPVWTDKFVPGVDFLVGADTVGMVLIVGSLLGRKKQPSQHRTIDS
jgi:urea transporter